MAQDKKAHDLRQIWDTSDSLVRVLSNSVGQDKMSHIATFLQGLHCLLR